MSSITRYISAASNFLKFSKIHLFVPTFRNIMSVADEHQFSKDFLFRQVTYDAKQLTKLHLSAAHEFSTVSLLK